MRRNKSMGGRSLRDNLRESWNLFTLIHQDENKARLLKFGEFIDRVNPESDGNLYWPKLANSILTDPTWGVKQYSEYPDIGEEVARLHRACIFGPNPSKEEWEKAREHADKAARESAANAHIPGFDTPKKKEALTHSIASADACVVAAAYWKEPNVIACAGHAFAWHAVSVAKKSKRYYAYQEAYVTYSSWLEETLLGIIAE
jgi:hypothetical protein